ncbi:MAG: hypothetical protein PUC26_04655 [Eubacteriales bacterium]|nr:hypothetical protein [Eubacteriales bacterium]
MFNSKRANVIISIVIAVVLWAYVIGVVDPATSHIVKDVQVKVTGVQTLMHRGLAISGLKKDDMQVSLTVRGKRSRIKRLNSSRIKAKLNISDCIKGENEIALTFDTPSGITVTDSSRSSITVTAASISLKKVPVEADFTDTSGSWEVGQVSVLPKKINVAGSRSQLAKVRKVLVTASSTRFDKDGSTLELEPEAVRENGDIVPYVRTVDKTVQVTGKLLSKKKVPLKVSTTGEKESNVKEFTIDDENIKILGEKKTLASIGSVTGTVDVTGLTQSKYRKVTFTDLPEGVEPAKKYKNIYVYVKVTKKDE